MSNPAIGSDAWKAQDKGPTILATCWAVTALSTIFVGARIYVRGVILKKLRSDDYFSILAQICGQVATALSTVAVVSFGNGKHTAVLTTEQQEGVILWTTMAFCPALASFSIPKLAVVSLLSRILNPGRFHKWVLWTIVIWCQMSFIASIGILLGRCQPPRSMWDFSVKGTCFDINKMLSYAYYVTAFSAFVDIYLAVYPAIVLFQLQLSLNQKLAPAVSLGISSLWKKIALAVALGIGSTSAIVAIYKATIIESMAGSDYSYDTYDLIIWNVVEGSTILIASSIPTLWPLVQLIRRHKPFSSSKESSDGTDNTAKLNAGFGTTIDDCGGAKRISSGDTRADTSCAGAMTDTAIV